MSTCDHNTLVRCLRVSEQFYDLAGDVIYKQVELYDGIGPEKKRHRDGMRAVLSGAEGSTAIIAKLQRMLLPIMPKGSGVA